MTMDKITPSVAAPRESLVTNSTGTDMVAAELAWPATEGSTGKDTGVARYQLQSGTDGVWRKQANKNPKTTGWVWMGWSSCASLGKGHSTEAPLPFRSLWKEGVPNV
jgi:hypothetical protein